MAGAKEEEDMDREAAQQEDHFREKTRAPVPSTAAQVLSFLD